jgi:hypothetical protein
MTNPEHADKGASAVGRILRTIAGFLRWLFSSEQLPAIEPQHEADRQEQRFEGGSRSGDALIERPRQPPGRERPQRFLSWVLAPDHLPAPGGESGVGSRPPGFLRRVFSEETLSQREAPESDRAPRTGFLRRVLAPEVCAAAQEPAPGRRRRFLRWVFSRDEL